MRLGDVIPAIGDGWLLWRLPAAHQLLQQAVTLTRLVTSSDVRGRRVACTPGGATQHGLPPTPRTALTPLNSTGKTGAEPTTYCASFRPEPTAAAPCMRVLARGGSGQDKSATYRSACWLRQVHMAQAAWRCEG